MFNIFAKILDAKSDGYTLVQDEDYEPITSGNYKNFSNYKLTSHNQ